MGVTGSRIEDLLRSTKTRYHPLELHTLLIHHGARLTRSPALTADIGASIPGTTPPPPGLILAGGPLPPRSVLLTGGPLPPLTCLGLEMLAGLFSDLGGSSSFRLFKKLNLVPCFGGECGLGDSSGGVFSLDPFGSSFSCGGLCNLREDSWCSLSRCSFAFDRLSRRSASSASFCKRARSACSASF